MSGIIAELKGKAEAGPDYVHKVRKARNIVFPVDDAPKFDSPPITSIVGSGEEQRTFYAHKEVLCKHSEFFRAALNRDRWKEGRENKVTMPEAHVQGFETFLRFIHTGVIYVRNQAAIDLINCKNRIRPIIGLADADDNQDESSCDETNDDIDDKVDEPSDGEGEEEVDRSGNEQSEEDVDGQKEDRTAEDENKDIAAEWSHLAHAWIEGQRLLSVSFKDAITDAMIASCQHFGLYPVLTGWPVGDVCTELSGFRELLIDIVTWKWDTRMFEQERTMSEGMGEFFLDCVQRMKLRAIDEREAKKELRPPWEGKNRFYCRYHEHLLAKNIPWKCWMTMFPL